MYSDSLYNKFLTQVKLQPDSVALIENNDMITYAKLNVVVNSIAQLLYNSNLHSQKKIAVILPRSLYYIATVLATWQLGNLFIPILSNTSIKRVEYIFHDANLDAIISMDNQKISELCKKLQITYLDLQLNQNNSIQTNLFTQSFVGDLAYMIYTSGSTGNPKGVLGGHNAILNRVNWMANTYPYHSNEMGCIKTPINFIDSITEIFTPLTAGVPSVILPEQDTKEILTLLEIIKQYKITRLVLVPSMLAGILALGSIVSDFLCSLKQIISSGEELTVSVVRETFKLLPKITLLNLYGSSEVAGDVLYYELQYQDKDLTTIPLGLPIAGQQIYLFDQDIVVNQDDYKAELVVSGIGLAQGYHKNIGEKQFVNLLIDNCQIPCFRTGDIAYRQNGLYYFSGRIDNVIKIRGNRVGLEEVEAGLMKISDVSSVVVIPKRKASGGTYLKAFIVLNENVDSILFEKEFQEKLSHYLPDYMYPEDVVYLLTLPRLLNGKIDRITLAEDTQYDNSVIYKKNYSIQKNTVPSEMQLWLSKHLEVLLSLKQVDIHKSFRSQGGDSLTATKLIFDIYCQYQVKLSVAEVLADRGLIDLLEDVITRSQTIEDVISPCNRMAVLPMASYAQETIWFMDLLTQSSAIYNVPRFFVCNGNVSIRALQKAFELLIKQHEILRTSFAIDNQGNLLQTILDTLEFTIMYCEDMSESELATIVDAAIHTRFELTAPPLLRVVLIKKTSDLYYLYLVMHQIISDGWSHQILYREITHYYNNIILNQREDLISSKLQYLDFAVWHRHYVDCSLTKQEILFWQQQYSLYPSKVSTVTPVMSYDGQTITKILKGNVLQQLNQFLISHSNCSKFSFLLSIFQVLWYAYTQEAHFIIGSAVHNRHYMGVQSLIGFFVNAIPIFTTIDETMSFIELVNQNDFYIKKVQEYQNIPIQRLSRLIGETNKNNQLFRTMFIMDNEQESYLQLQGMKLIRQPIATRYCRYDLTMTVSEVYEDLWFQVEYSLAAYHSEEIEMFLSNFISLVDLALAGYTKSIKILIDAL